MLIVESMPPSAIKIAALIAVLAHLPWNMSMTLPRVQ